MANEGWHPDPSGQAGMFRYWDGASWSQETSNTPDAPPPGSVPPAPPAPPAAPPPPVGAHDAPTMFPGAGAEATERDVPGPGALPPAAPTAFTPGPPPAAPTAFTPGAPAPGMQPPPGMPPAAPPSWGAPPGAPGAPGGSGKRVGLILGVIVLVLAIGVGGFFGVKALTGDDEKDPKGGGGTATAQTSGPTDDITETTGPTDPTESTPVGPITADPTSQTCLGGDNSINQGHSDADYLYGGGLRIDHAPRVYHSFELTDPLTGEKNTYTQDEGFKFADGVRSLSKLISSTFVSGYALGSLPVARGYTDVRVAAETAVSCLAQQASSYHQPAQLDIISSGASSVDGHDAWRVDADIQGSGEDESGVLGDHLVIEVVDVGDPERLGFYAGYIPLGFDDLLPELNQITESLTVQ